VTTDPALYPTERLTRMQEAVRKAGIDVLLLTPGPDLRYVTGYDAKQLERLTCLAVPADDDPFLVVPGLELKAAQASPAGQLNVDMIPWGELTDPFAIIAGKVGSPELVALSDRMWALHVLQFAKALPAAGLRLASEVVSPLRMRKTPAEVAALRAAGEAIDRVIRSGDVVVVDIGGTMPSGYCSDCTRTYAVGGAPDDFSAYYEVLKRAQEAATASVRPGVTAESVDRAARGIIEDAGYGEWFIHRTGHGIGLETHEEPYIVEGNATRLENGMAFSIEPGIYPGPHGARIEDIVVCTETGVERLNNGPRELVIV
jgi:Xaa-Pro aminopeptidase